MKALKTLIEITQEYLWFGSQFPCNNDYHSGYENERRDRISHSDCARTIWRRRIDWETQQVAYCGCRNMQCDAGGNAHYTFYEDEEQLIRAWNEGEGQYLCIACAAGVHPEAPTQGRSH